MKYDEYLEFDVRLIEKFKDDEEFMKKYKEYLKGIEDYEYNSQEIEIED